MYDCPKCGKKDGSFDGMTFCGPCEARYQLELRQELEWKKENLRRIREKHGDDCDCVFCRPHSSEELW